MINADYLMDDKLAEKFAEKTLALTVGEDGDIEKGKRKGIERYEQLTLLEKFIICRDGELMEVHKQLKTKYNMLAAETTKLRKENEQFKTGTIFWNYQIMIYLFSRRAWCDRSN